MPRLKSTSKITKKYLHKAREAQMEILQGVDLQRVAEAGSGSASGVDQWSPGDLKLMPPYAFELLAQFLNGIESGKMASRVQ